MKRLFSGVIALGVVTVSASLFTSELVVENIPAEAQLAAAPAASSYLVLSSTNQRPTVSAEVMNSPVGIDARFSGLLSHVLWLMAQEKSRNRTTVRSERDDSVVWRQIDSLMDNSSDYRRDFRSDLEEAFDTSVLTVDENASIAGTLSVTGSTVLANLSADSLFLPSLTPATTTNLLYNTGGELYWNGSPVASGGGSGSWDINGADAYRLTGNVGIGTNTPLARLDLDDGDMRIFGDIRTDEQSATLTFLGVGAGHSNTVTGISNQGTGNTGIGWLALTNNTTGNQNTAVGRTALSSNTTGVNNSATGFGALGSNTTGNFNTANGFYALFANTTAQFNTAVGVDALRFTTTGGVVM